jgi:lysine 2,3-aminomutase
MPNYLVSASDNAVILRNYEGLLFRYAPEDKDGGEQTHYSSLGVSGLLGSQGGALIPVGNRRMARREEHEHDAESNGNGLANGNGHHNSNGHANGNGKLHTNGHAKLNGNGHANGNGKPFAGLPIIDRLS